MSLIIQIPLQNKSGDPVKIESKKKISKRQIVLVLWLNPIHSNPYPECNCTHTCEKCVVDDHCSHHFSTTAFILLCHSRKYEREKEEKTLLYKEQDNVNEISMVLQSWSMCCSASIFGRKLKKWTTMDHFSSVFLTVFSPLDFGKKDNQKSEVFNCTTFCGHTKTLARGNRKTRK